MRKSKQMHSAIGRVRLLDPARLEQGAYFESLLREAALAGLLQPEEADALQLQLWALLAQQSEAYHLGESSSIRVEHAESILQSICFVLGICCKALPGPEEAVDYLLRTPLSQAYAQGQKHLRAKQHYAMHLYKQARATRTQANLRAYHDTLRQEDGIGDFFRHYNTAFAAHEIPGTIDYPLCLPVSELLGVEYIIEHLQHLTLENAFCAFFAPEPIHHLLLGYSSGYSKLLLNLFRQLFAGALCCALCGRPVRELFFTEMDAKRIQAACLRRPEGIAPALQKAAVQVRRDLEIPQGGELAMYMARSLEDISAEAATISKAGATNPLFSPPAPPVIVY